MILNEAENVRQTGMILIDLQKVFDTLDHKILFDKMKPIGFSDKTTKWFHSYLINIVFFVSFDVFGAGTINCRSSSRIYIRTFIVFATSSFRGR